MPALKSLIDDFLTQKYAWPDAPGQLLTAVEQHHRYLSSLRGKTDYICGQINGEAASAVSGYMFDGHQWHLRFPSRRHVVDDMLGRLADIDNERFDDFDQLYRYVYDRRVQHFGDTCVYDFALRYGWNMTRPLIPQQYVYLHSQPLRAATHLCLCGLMPRVSARLSTAECGPLTLYGLDAMEAEHFLCVCHDEIMKFRKQ